MRQEKNLLLDEIKEKIESSNAFILTKYENVTPLEAWNVRQNLSKTKGELEIVKKRILIKALEKCGLTYQLDDLTGHIAVVFIADDPIANIKVVFNFANETKKMEVISGEMEGKKYDKNEMEMLSKIPPLNDLRAQFVGLLEAPMSQTISAMQSLLTSILYILEEKQKKGN